MTTEIDLEKLGEFGRIVAGPSRIPPSSPLRFAERAVEGVEQRLSEKGPRSLVVVGPSGVGKTAVLTEVFRRLAEKDGTTVLSTTTSLVMAGTKYLGEWQTRVRDLVTETSTPKNVLVYMGDVNMLHMTGRSDTSTDNFATYLRPYMESGDITVVGESTPEELAVGLNRAPEFKRLFREVAVAEPTRAQTLEIVREHAAQVSDGFGDDLLEQVLEMAGLYVPDGAFPGKAVDLLKQTVMRLERALGRPPQTFRARDLIDTLAERTGLPHWLIDDVTPLDVDAVRAFFAERILGQDEAVSAITDLITLIKAGLTDPRKPFAVLFFVGPTGVGKTEIAKALAEFLFGDADRLVRLDMSEFKTYEGYQRLIGIQSWNTRLEEGLLTKRVRAQPFSVVLLDEFEKAHPNVYDLMLQVFDDGRLTSGRGEVVSFRQTIVIMTSNLGSGRGASSLGFVERDQSPQRRDVMRSLEEYFRPEFINRVDRVVVFEALDIDVMRRVAKREIDKVLRRGGLKRRGLLVEVDESVVTLLLQEGFSPIYGARPLKRVLERQVLLPLARRVVSGIPHGSLVRVSAVEGKIRVRVLPTVDDEAPTVPPAQMPDVDLAAQVAACRRAADERGLAREKEKLLTRMQAEDIWRSPAEARRVTDRVHRLEQLLSALEQAEREAAVPRRRGSDALRRKVARLRLHFAFDDAADGGDAWLFLRRLDDEDVGIDPVRRMIETYAAWAGAADCEATVLDERPRTALVRVSGLHAYGQLRGEAGLHRFARRGKNGGARVSALVRISVLPAAPPDFVLAPGDVVSESRALHGEAAKRKRRSWARAVHRPTLLVAEGTNALAPDANREAMLDLLAARVASSAGGDEPDVVRVFYLPEGEVRDLATGLRSTDWDSALDIFIAARCEERAPLA